MKTPNKTIAALLLAAACLGGNNRAEAQIAITLPPPFFFESFDAVEEGSLPTGWTVTNFTQSATEGIDLDDPRSDSYLDWVVISRERVAAISWDANRRLNTLPGQIVNGVEVTNLVSGNFIYAESDTRGGSQVQYLFTPNVDCTGKTNVYLSYHSIYEQNQDNIGSVEYSITVIRLAETEDCGST